MTKLSDNLLLHPNTLKQVELFLRRPTQSLLILGEIGSGKTHLAQTLATTILQLESNQKLLIHPYFLKIHIPEGKQDIPIESVRKIIHLMQLKTLGTNNIKRFVIIEDAHLMSIEAQNALLKILEEPNDDTIFILTAPYELSLLPTIVSRCQKLTILPVTLNSAVIFYKNKYSIVKIESSWQLSQGNVALLEALLKNENNHPLKQSIDQAKAFLKQSKYERLLLIDKLSKNREDISYFLLALSKVLAALHYVALNKNQTKQLNKLLNSRKLVRYIMNSMDKNVNLKLANLKLVTDLEI